jgi:hypothetical protein
MKFLQSLKASKHYSFRVTIETIIENTLGLFLFQYQKKNNMFNWFYNSLKYQLDNESYSPRYNYYEFGVASGGSMKIYILALKKFCKDYNQDINKYHIFGFDSFSGLPDAKEEDSRQDWTTGNFSYGKEVVLKMVNEVGFPIKNLHLIEGYFEDSLTSELKKECEKNPPSIVNMDADFHSSTMTAFLWLQDMLSSGTLFRFDDIWAFYGHPEKGEVKAISDFNALNNGYLTSFPILGLESYAYVYAKKHFEYV